jgi:hypothetical protein
MFKPGDKFYFKHDTKQEPFTVKAVSADGEMIESEELGGWSWADGAILLDEDLLFLFPVDKCSGTEVPSIHATSGLEQSNPDVCQPESSDMAEPTS